MTMALSSVLLLWRLWSLQGCCFKMKGSSLKRHHVSFCQAKAAMAWWGSGMEVPWEELWIVTCAWKGVHHLHILVESPCVTTWRFCTLWDTLTAEEEWTPRLFCSLTVRCILECDVVTLCLLFHPLSEGHECDYQADTRILCRYNPYVDMVTLHSHVISCYRDMSVFMLSFSKIGWCISTFCLCLNLWEVIQKAEVKCGNCNRPHKQESTFVQVCVCKHHHSNGARPINLIFWLSSKTPAADAAT